MFPERLIRKRRVFDERLPTKRKDQTMCEIKLIPIPDFELALYEHKFQGEPSGGFGIDAKGRKCFVFEAHVENVWLPSPYPLKLGEVRTWFLSA